MDRFFMPLQLRWADIDANRHLRHSVYYDFGALCRMQLLSERGLTTDALAQLGIGPVLFREEAVFRREIKFEDSIRISCAVWKTKADFSRWSFRHEFLKTDDTVATTLTVEGAWIDLALRKLAVPPGSVREVFDRLPKAPDFQLIS